MGADLDVVKEGVLLKVGHFAPITLAGAVSRVQLLLDAARPHAAARASSCPTR